MSGACRSPGPKSLQGLAWLARVGAAPIDALELIIGCSRRKAHDHVHRLVDAGLVRRIPTTRGDGSLIVVTTAGAIATGEPSSRAPRTLELSTWAHSRGCAWVAAWLAVRGRDWHSEREISDDDFWRWTLTYTDARGAIARVTHRPDLGVEMPDGPIAIEVELQRKSLRRLRAITALYAQLCEPDGPLAGVIYITDRPDVAAPVTRAADEQGLQRIRFETLADVVEQARAASSVAGTTGAPA